MQSPVYANAYRDAALVINRASARFWIAFRPHRDVSTSLGISAAVHLIVLFAVGTAMYVDGQDDEDVPELSVQLVTREGSNDEEFTEASLPLTYESILSVNALASFSFNSIFSISSSRPDLSRPMY